MAWTRLLALFFACATVQALTLSSGSKIFTSSNQADTKLRYVKNSGICETTGPEQISGYIDVGKNMSMWFWFFEARENPEKAPFTLWCVTFFTTM